MVKYLILGAEIKQTSKGSDYLSLSVSDGTTKDSLSVWNPPAGYTPGDCLHKVITSEIKDKDGFKSTSFGMLIFSSIDNEPENSPLRSIKIRSSITQKDFLKAIEACSKLFTHQRYVNFLKFINPEGLAKAYGDTPAALKVHHAIKGGLIEHVYEMLSLYYNMSKSAFLRDLRHEYCVFAIMFHDYGKMYEYDLQKWDATELYPLMGHIYISAHTLHNLLDKYNYLIQHAISSDEDSKVPNGLIASEEMLIPKRDIECMVHCILAHHGKREYGSPVVPAIREASIMHFVDNISGNDNQFVGASNMEKSYFLDTKVVKDY